MAITDFLKKNNIGVGDIAAGANGINSLVQGLSAKKPKAYKAKEFKAAIRPAQADIEGLNRTKTRIAEQTAGAIKDVKSVSGSDGNKSIRGILGVQANANKAGQEAEAEASKQYIADQNRVSEQQSLERQINNQNQNHEGMINNQQNQATRNGKIAAMNQGLQSTANYFIAKDADTKNKEIIGKQADQAVTLGYEATRAQTEQTFGKYFDDPDKLGEFVDGKLAGHPGFYPRKKKPLINPIAAPTEVAGPNQFVAPELNAWIPK